MTKNDNTELLLQSISSHIEIQNALTLSVIEQLARVQMMMCVIGADGHFARIHEQPENRAHYEKGMKVVLELGAQAQTLAEETSKTRAQFAEASMKTTIRELLDVLKKESSRD